MPSSERNALYWRIKRGLVKVVLIGRYPSSPEHRFFAQTDKEGPIHRALGTRCWLWIGKSNRGGYGRIVVRGSEILAHRCSWELHHGPVPDGLCVLHQCDNCACVNPAHLFLGTQVDNRADCIAKDRQAKGEKHGEAKLTEEQVLDIRQRYRRWRHSRSNASELASEADVNKTTILRIVSHKNWTHI